MKYPSKEYDELVQRNLRGNVSSVKMTPQECEAEIAKITEGAKSSFEDELTNISESADNIAQEIADIQPKKRRGRPPGSKNKSKT